MSVSNIDLAYNLTLSELHVFCLVCESRNLSQVAQRLEMSQSSLSQMVQRWRQLVGDPLFVRARYGVVPTEVAMALREKIHPLLEGMKLALAHPRGFEAATSERVFKIHMSDIGQLVFLSELNSFLNHSAPGIHLRVRNLPWEDVEKGLGAGDIDIAIGSLPMIKGRVHARTLRKEKYVTVMRRQHRLAKKRLDLEAFASAEHLVIDSTGSGHALVEGVLRSMGVRRKIGLTIPHFLAAEAILGKSDYLLTVPEVAVSAFHQPSGYHVVPAPVSLPTFDIRVHWHERSRQEEGVQWLRTSIIDMFTKK